MGLGGLQVAADASRAGSQQVHLGAARPDEQTDRQPGPSFTRSVGCQRFLRRLPLVVHMPSRSNSSRDDNKKRYGHGEARIPPSRSDWVGQTPHKRFEIPAHQRNSRRQSYESTKTPPIPTV